MNDKRLPQLGKGSVAPNPKNESATSALMNCGTRTTACVQISGKICGSRCRRKRYKAAAPNPRVAMTKLRSFALRTPRTSSAGEADSAGDSDPYTRWRAVMPTEGRLTESGLEVWPRGIYDLVTQISHESASNSLEV